MKKKLLFTFIICSSLLIQGQTQKDKENIIKQTNIKELNELSRKWDSTFVLNSQLSIAPLKKISPINNATLYLSGFDKNGNPQYDQEDNEDAAETNFADKIWLGGSSGLHLTGNNVEIGHWEAGGLAQSDHNELTGRITHEDNTEPETSHATHTAGTMIGVGVNSSARGMASSATIKSWRSNSNESEMASFAAAGGILSNHSYATGNPSGDIPKYGAYTTNAGEWDEIVYNAPYFTISKSAGNNRNDGVNTGDGGYDIIYTVSGSKNVITVGAVLDISNYTGEGSVSMTDFSNWGPTDDWRIKPDLVTNGYGLYSAEYAVSPFIYASKSGTSMAAAVNTGIIALLQEHYQNENTVYMKAATVKALLISTTEEAGANDGPDFQYGWGLLNAEKAAATITNHGASSLIRELSLANSDTYTFQFEVDGTVPLTVAIAWTDPKGTPVSGTDNQTPMLVNDLDMTVTKDATTYSPWVMTPNATSNNFTDAATKGDNFRDNVERIDVETIPTGTYTVTVNHKGTLSGGSQDFSLVINGASNTSLSTDDYTLNSDKLMIYPNPSTNKTITIKHSTNDSFDGQLKIFDVQGRTVYTESIATTKKTIDLNNITTGMYFVEITTDKEVYRKRVILK